MPACCCFFYSVVGAMRRVEEAIEGRGGRGEAKGSAARVGAERRLKLLASMVGGC